MDVPSLSDLLSRWSESFRRGLDLTPEQLCPEGSEPPPELHRAVNGLRQALGRMKQPWAAPGEPFPGEYELFCPLGEGSFGSVWLACERHTDRLVALKCVPRAGLGYQLEALLNEARALATLGHRHVVQLYTVRETPEAVYLVLQYVPGGSLADRVAREGKPLGWELAARYVADGGEGLMAVHKRHRLHRDVKPGNVLWDSEADEALLTDFGTAAWLGKPGTVAGTLPFMAPEVMSGTNVPASDAYSLAATLFWLVSGQYPFAVPDCDDLYEQLAQMQRRIAAGLPEADARFADLPRPLERLIRAGLCADEAARPALADFVGGLRGDLNRLLADSLVPPGEPGGAGVELAVSRQVGGRWERLAATAAPAAGVTRNMKKVPKGPEQVRLRTGDQVRIEVRASEAGYVTVFNVGPDGELTPLFPDEAAAPTVRAGQWTQVADVQLEPPTGRERLFAVWTRGPLALSEEHLRELSGAEPPAPAYRSTRNMAKVKRLVQGLPAGERRVVVLELDHVG